MSFVEDIRRRAASLKRRIVFPESGDERVRGAAVELQKLGVVQPLMVVDGDALEV